MRVRPATPGAIIRDPKTKKALPDDGANVGRSLYWRRRLRDGSVVPVEDEDEVPVPTGREPVVPLTTRRMPLPGVPAYRGDDDK